MQEKYKCASWPGDVVWFLVVDDGKKKNHVKTQNIL